MLSHSKLSKAFWGEALYTTVHLINLSPSYPLHGDTPEHVWKGGNKISYDYLRVLGCRIFIHIPGDERAKLDKNTKECIFLGYGISEYRYRLWDPIQRKIVWSRDVVFCEDKNIQDISRTKPTPTTEAPVDLSPTDIDQGGIPPQP